MREGNVCTDTGEIYIQISTDNWQLMNPDLLKFVPVVVVTCELCRTRTASTDQCVPTFVSCGLAGCWRALDRRPASSACWPTRKPQWWEEEQGSRSSGAL